MKNRRLLPAVFFTGIYKNRRRNIRRTGYTAPLVHRAVSAADVPAFGQGDLRRRYRAYGICGDILGDNGAGHAGHFSCKKLQPR